MGKNLVYKILSAHLVSGTLAPGERVAIRMDQALTQDATGTMAYLQFEAMGIPRIQTELAVSYADHNVLQTGFENADDHRYLQSAATKYGAYFSRPGNGICHQVHLERFAQPGKTLIGSDSHTPTAGGMGMIAIGAGGLDVAAAMGGASYYINVPKVVNVFLTGELPPWVSAKDIILELLRRISVKGGLGKIMEYTGPGVSTLAVPQRATITNMGAELGATSSVFLSDEVTRNYLRAQGREECWRELLPDVDAEYDEEIEINLSELEPLIALPSSPDNVKPVREVEGTPVAQVCVGSCTNSSYYDLMVVANILNGKRVHPSLNMTISPGSKQVYEMIAREGALAELVAAGCRILESACGPCIGMGQAPPSGGASVRSFNRNFKGRSGTADDFLYLCGPETCAATALEGKITDPRSLGEMPKIEWPERFIINDNMIIPPAKDPSGMEVVRGPNIKPVPLNKALPERVEGQVLLKVGDNITTDHIMPAGAKVLPLRSNIPAISEHVFENVDPTFPERAHKAGGGFVVGGENYGQGSSREHAALAPMFLGLKGVIAKSFARIHRANLVNFGILPLELATPADYESLEQGDELELTGVSEKLKKGEVFNLINKTKGKEIALRCPLDSREFAIIKAGGLLNWTREQQR